MIPKIYVKEFDMNKNFQVNYEEIKHKNNGNKF